MSERTPKSRGTVLESELTLLRRGPDEEIDASWQYHADDPYAVKLVLYHERDEFGIIQPVEWELSRELLAEATYSSKTVTGIGDVQYTKLGKPNNETDMLIHLRSNTGEAKLVVPIEDIEDFLKLTREIVPFGKEKTLRQINRTLKLILPKEENKKKSTKKNLTTPRKQVRNLKRVA